MNNEEFWIEYLNKRGLVLRNAKGEATHQDVYDLLNEQKKQDLLEFLGAVRDIIAKVDADGSQSSFGEFKALEKVLNYLMAKIEIDAKLRELS